MEVRGQLRTPDALVQEKKPPVSMEKEAGVTAEPIWNLWGTKSFYFNSPTVQFSA
jgi:hypothetical protein